MTSLFSFTSSSNATCRGTSLLRSCNHVGGGPKGGMGASAPFGEESSAGEILIPKSIFLKIVLKVRESFWTIPMNIKDIMK